MKRNLQERSIMRMARMSFRALGIVLILISLVSVQAFAKETPNRVLTVALDAGHGGNDKGVVISGDRFENDLTLELVRQLKKTLDKSGAIRSVLTRNANEPRSSHERMQTAQAQRADLILSIHVNAGFSKGSTGYEMYFPGFGSPEAGKNDSREIIKDMVQTNYLNESIRYMKILQVHLDKVFPRKGRGLREAPISLSGQSIPTVVLEIGFATNPKDRKTLLDETIQKSLVEALSGSLQEYAASRK